MKLIGLMIARNEDWVLRASIRAAMKWCDGMVVLLDRCTDKSAEVVHETLNKLGKPAIASGIVPEGEHWNEMHVRQHSLELGRQMGGTHFAVVDADEILTGNLHKQVRNWFVALQPKQCLDVRMVSPFDGLDQYRVEDSEWTRARITLGFCDHPDLGWAPRGDEQYHHHARAPRGEVTPRHEPPLSGEQGGIMHLQWANRRRLLAKHKWYAAMELVRWPEYGAAKINWRYSLALDRSQVKTAPIPHAWWEGVDKEGIDVSPTPSWHEVELERLYAKYGREHFKGLGILGLER